MPANEYKPIHRYYGSGDEQETWGAVSLGRGGASGAIARPPCPQSSQKQYFEMELPMNNRLAPWRRPGTSSVRLRHNGLSSTVIAEDKFPARPHSGLSESTEIGAKAASD